jgi:hypothetical protein
MFRTARLIQLSLLTATVAVLACQDWSDTQAPPADEPALEGPSLDDNPQFQSGGPVSADSATMGSWTAPFAWVNVGVHLSLLPDGKVLSFGRLNGGTPQVWDPATGTFSPFGAPSLLFCSGHTFLSGGRLLVAGGHIQDGLGLPNTNTFDYQTRTWSARSPMAWGRWYPTITLLGNGEAVALGGTDQAGATVLTPEIFSPSSGTWRKLTAATAWMPYYPRTFLAPNGQIFYAGELQGTSYLNTSGNGSWTFVANRQVAGRDYGSAVMYQPGKVIYIGGGDPPTATAEIIDLTKPGPAWQFTNPMSVARRQISATILPDGRVAVTGGTQSSGFTTMAGAVRHVEVWDPATGGWTVWASSSIPRGYHNTTVLLPDGRLLHTGSGDGAGIPDELNAEVFSPPYLFSGPRPVVSSAPATLRYGASVSIGTPNPALVSYASLVRLSSNTHSFDMGQGYTRMQVTRSGSSVTVRLPASANRLAPGPYMLFLLSTQGVPSVARMVRVY